MQSKLLPDHFKLLSTGKNTKEQLFSSWGRPVWPDIDVKMDSGVLTISGSFTMASDITFDGDDYDYPIIIDGGNFKNINVIGGTFKSLTFRRGDFQGYVSLRGGSFENISILGGKFHHWLGTLNGIFNKSDDGSRSLAHDALKIQRFQIEGGIFANNIWISGGNIGSLELKCVSAIKVHCKPNDDKILNSKTGLFEKRYESYPTIGLLEISRYSTRDTFYDISDITLDTLSFSNFTNIGSITIANTSIANKLEFLNSDLGKTTFINTDLSSAILSFNSSKITEMGLAGSSLPSGPRLVTNGILERKLALSQIKKSYQNMGDSVTAMQYQAEELETYKKTLALGWEKLTLAINGLSNNHGQSWERALGWILIVTAVLYSMFCYSLGFRPSLEDGAMSVFWKNLSLTLEFINPIRKSEFLVKALTNKDEYNIPTAAIAIDSFAKLINAYLIYQLVAAFRRHGKKTD